MIKIQKGAEPIVLTNNKGQWTKDLLFLVKKYGSYSDIPKNEKDAAIRYYSHPEIAAALKGQKGKAKCVYCESYVDLTCFANIEHFHPKSIYPGETFDWSNIFVGCALCNTSKNDFDTLKEPFIHPVNDDPEDYLTFDDLIYTPRVKTGLDYQRALNVIEKCDLERIPLARKHAEILFTFMGIREAIRKKLLLYQSRKKDSMRLQDAAALLSSLLVLDGEASDDAEYASYMRFLLRKYCEIKDAVAIINLHKNELALPNGFVWSFKF